MKNIYDKLIFFGFNDVTSDSLFSFKETLTSTFNCFILDKCFSRYKDSITTYVLIGIYRNEINLIIFSTYKHYNHKSYWQFFNKSFCMEHLNKLINITELEVKHYYEKNI